MAIVADACPAPDWSDAACRDEDPELFFPIGETGPDNEEQIEDARAVCLQGGPGGEACPVRTECLLWALATRQEFGVWGGASEKERRKVLRRKLDLSGLGVAA